MEKDELIQKSLDLLGWKELCHQLSLLATSSTGKELCLHLKPEEEMESVLYQMKLTSEMREYLNKEEGFPLSPFQDLRPQFHRLSTGDVLLPGDLLEIRHLIRISGRVKESLKAMSSHYPGLHEISSRLEVPHSLADKIERSIDDDGAIREDATETLRILIGKSRIHRGEIIQRLDEFIKDPAVGKVLQDRYYTQRDGRYVIPFKAGHKTEGIIHDVSSSGSTHFVEPPWLLELNNQMKLYQLEIEREIERILKELSEMARDALHILKEDLDILSQIDLILAKAKLSIKLDASEPHINTEDSFHLKGLRHPLLSLSRKVVTASDVEIPPNLRVLIISGPNAGGKTVALKAIGIACLMCRSGLHIPAERGSSIPFIQEVYADIGDEQDLTRDISTFSGHILNILSILNHSSRRSLVLIDEIAGSTDPLEGEALAAAFLEAFSRKGARTVVTTHYGFLKSLALVKEGYENASMEFDTEKMMPTYRLIFGLPGHSSPIEIAARLGLPDEISRHARDLLKERGPTVDGIIKELEKRRHELEELKKEAISEMERAKIYREEAQKVLLHLKEEEMNFRFTKKRRLEREISELRTRIKEMAKELKNKEDWDFLAKKREDLRRIEEEINISFIPKGSGERIPIKGLCKGDEVEILPLGRKGILLEDPRDKEQGPLRVKIGTFELQIDQKHLGSTDVHRKGGAPVKAKRSKNSYIIESTDASPIPLDLDIRGMTSEEAIIELEKFLDRAYLNQFKQVKIIHGHGTGILKKAVREYLQGSSYVSRFSPGSPKDGGDGVTIATINKMEG